MAVALIAFVVAASVVLLVGEGGGAPDGGPAAWAVVEVGPDQETIVIQPYGEFGGGCRKVRTDIDQHDGVLRLTVNIHQDGCEFETMESRRPPVTEVALPDGMPATGLQLEGPGFRGALQPDRGQNAFAYSDHRGGRRYPNVVGLRWELARDILNAAGATSVEPNGPTSAAAHVTAQSPPGARRSPASQPHSAKHAR